MTATQKFVQVDGLPGVGSSALIPLWKNDVVGTPFVDGDTVAAPGPLTAATTLLGRRIMIVCDPLETVTVTMPAVAAGNAGQVIGIYENSGGVKDYGLINLDPAGTDSIAGGGAGTTRAPSLDDATPWLEMASDGNDDWICPVGMFTTGPNAAFTP